MVNKADVLVRLFETIEKRSKEDPSKSYTAKLLSEGKAKCIEKLKEESLETVEAAEQGNAEQIIYENLLISFIICLYSGKNLILQLTKYTQS